MYIRRKAYSVVIDENGEEKLFSTTEIMSEESYLEKLYSESEPEQKVFSLFKQDKFPIILKKIDNLKKSNFGFLEDYLTDLKLTRIPYSVEKSNNRIILFSGIENESVIVDLSNKTVNLPSSGLKTFLSKRSIKKLEDLDSYDLFQMAFNQIYYDIAQRIYNNKTTVDLLGFKKVNELFDRFNKEFKKCGGLIR